MTRLHRWSFAVVAVICLGCANLFHPLLRGEWVGNVGDGRWNMYLLEHHYKVLTDRQYPGTYSSAPFWVPDNRNNLAYSDLMAGGEPIYAPARMVMSVDGAFQFFLIASALANFAAFFLLAVEAGAPPAAALAVAGLYAFGAHRVQHLGHTQFALQAWGVLALWSLLRFLRRRESRYLACLVLTIGLQTATSAYSGYLLLLGIAFWLTGWAVLRWDECKQLLGGALRNGLSWLGAATAAAIVPALLLAPYLRMSGASLRREWWEVDLHLPPAWFWIQPLSGSFLDRMRTVVAGPGPGVECHFAGAAIWLVVLAGFGLLWRSRRDPVLRLMAACAAAAFLLMALVTRWTPDGWVMWRVLYDHLPGADGMRDMRRISMVANTLLMLAAALSAGRLTLSKWGRRTVLALAALAVFENVAPHHYHFPRDWYQDASREIRTAIRGASAAGAFLDPAIPDYAFNYNLQLLGQELNVPVLNGSSGRYIPGYPPVMRPWDVIAKGDRLSFDGLVYLVPVGAEKDIAKELSEAGLSLRSRGTRFATYTPNPENPGYDVDFRPQFPNTLRARPGEMLRVPVLVTNRSRYVWQSVGTAPTQVIYRISPERDPGRETNGEVTDLTRMLPPQGIELVYVKIPAPREAGAYRLHLAMIRQGRAIFEPLAPDAACRFTLQVE